MLITARLHAPSEPLHPSRPKCPRCGSALLVAEESRFVPSGRIDHDWLCDDCGNTFSTSIKLGSWAFEPSLRGRLQANDVKSRGALTHTSGGRPPLLRAVII